ncbi:hypothetical protein [Brevibacillus formosus]|uniref:hypothetical protein n=1 Tax=Brevibacillus formosus TaxID=54913 RepID=UPI003F1D0A98
MKDKLLKRELCKRWGRTGVLVLALAVSSPAVWSSQAMAEETAQTQWDKQYEYTFGDFYENFQTGKDGDGFFSRISADRTEYEIVRIDKSGALKKQAGIPSTELIRLSTFTQTADGGFLLSGPYKSGSSKGYNYRLIKIDGDGSIEWRKTIDGSYEIYSELEQTADGGYVFGTTEYLSNNSFTDIHVFKLDQDGNPEWDKTFEGGDYNTVKELHQTADGGIVLLGSAGQDDSDYRVNADVFLAKVNGSGETEWEYRYETGKSTYASDLAETPDGGLIVAGIDKKLYYDGSGSGLGYLLKVNEAGEKEWEKKFSEDTTTSGVNYIRVTKEGGFLISGYVDYDRLNMDFAKSDEYIAHMDADGNKIWEIVIPNVTEKREGQLIVPVPDGEGYLAIGTGDKYEGGGDHFLYVTKLK